MARKSKKQKKRATAMRYLVVLLLIALFALVVSMAMKGAWTQEALTFPR